MSKYTKEQAISTIIKCAKQYKNELLNKTLLFICTDKHKCTKYYEFSFYKHNFMHLTGVKSKNISANDFFNKCITHKLSPNDFELAEDGTTPMKLRVLPSLLCKNLSVNMIGDYKSFQPRLITKKIAGNVKACMGFIVDSNKEKYVPNTVLKEDMRKVVSSYMRVIAVYRKTNNEQYYKEVTYTAKNTDWDNIKYPDEFVYLQNKHRM